jgi:hypothetical protein
VRRAFLQDMLEDDAAAAPQPTPAPASARVQPRKWQDRGICLVRTQGRRFNLLADALHSITSQAVPITPCIIVHGDQATFDLTSRWISKLGVDAVLLHADNRGRRRGYPLNVGLDHVASHAGQYDFLCLLDDDDIYYPMFGVQVSEALASTDWDVVYVQASQREPGAAATPAVRPMPTACLVAGNFIPSNCFAVRVDTLVASGARFPENMDYLEDWDFLLSLLTAGARFGLVPEVHSEIRVIADGSKPIKTNPHHYAECHERIKAHSLQAAEKLGFDGFIHSCMDFDFRQRPPLYQAESALLIDARRVFLDVSRNGSGSSAKTAAR